MTRPQLSLRATVATAAVGVLGSMTYLGAGALAAAQTSSTGAQHPARVAAYITTHDVRRELLVGQTAFVSGALRPGGAGHRVALQVRRGGRWNSVAHATTHARGRFTLRYRTRVTGSRPARVRFSGDRATRPARQTLGRLNVYRRAFASWYGPGLYGGHLGCGGRLTPGTLGVANKTLPCGSKLTLRFHGRSVRVSVVDRGPYVAGREFDLTAATKQRLRFGSTGYVLTTR